MKFRFKTEKEFINEYGKDWRKTPKDGIWWDDEMDYLFGQSINYMSSTIDDWNVSEWMVTLNLIGGTQTVQPDEQTRPDYYRYTIKGIEFDVIDIVEAMKLPFPLGLALKYFRIKGDKQKQINDLEKAIECINRQIKILKQ